VKGEAIEQSVGWIWCPAKGISCRYLDDSVFVITFNQVSGMRKALDDGPCTIYKELLIIAEFDETKSAEEMEFVSFPIWMRVERLPFGMMNQATVQVIGDDIGKFMEANVDSDDMAIGRALHIKVWLDVRKPLR
jgi:hypothetical protein